MAALTGGVAQGGSEVGLAEPDPAAEDRIGAFRDEAQFEQMADLRLVDLLGPVPVELVEGLAHGETGRLDSPLARDGNIRDTRRSRGAGGLHRGRSSDW